MWPFDLLHTYLPNPVILQIGQFSLRWYGLFMVLGVAAGFSITRRLWCERGLAAKELESLVFWLVLAGLIGARLLDVFVYEWWYFKDNLTEIFYLWQGGLAWHGGLWGALPVLIVWAKKHQHRILSLVDMFAPGLAVLVIIWFGVPLLLNLFGGDEAVAPHGGSGNINAPQAKVSREQLETSDDPAKGSSIAPIVIVEFGDFQCPFCRESVPIINEVLRLYPEAVRLIYRDFPAADIHPEAVSAAEAANCAGRQDKFWPYHDALYSRQDELGEEVYLALARSLRLDENDFSQCLSRHETLSDIQSDFNDGVRAGVRGTPTWFVNGRHYAGTLPLDVWKKIIETNIRQEFSARRAE